jgi:hypothetical protein
MPEKNLLENLVKHYMLGHAVSYMGMDGTINCTGLGEDAALEFDWDEADLDTIFEWAFEVAQEVERANETRI